MGDGGAGDAAEDAGVRQIRAPGARSVAREWLGSPPADRVSRFLTWQELQMCRQASKSWKQRWRGFPAPKELWDAELGCARRAAAWKGLLLDGLSVRALGLRDPYETLCRTPCVHDAAIQRDLARTLPQEALFREKAGRGQRSLFRLLRALAVQLWDVGYVQSLNFIIATLIGVFPDDEALVFHCAQALLFRYSLVDFYRPRFPKLGVTVWQFDRLVQGFLPKAYEALHRHGISSEYYAMQWFLTLFASDLPQAVVRRIWDRFLLAGWCVVAQVGLALLREVQDTLAELDTCEALTLLKRFVRARRFEAEGLLKAASTFEVTHRMLSELEAAFESSPCAAGVAGGLAGKEEQEAHGPPPAELIITKDLDTGEVCWAVQRPAGAARHTQETAPTLPALSAARRSCPSPTGHGGDGTVLPFLFHNLDTGETTVMQKEWDAYLQEAEAKSAAAAVSNATGTFPARERGCRGGGGAFWMASRQQHALQALGR